MTARNERNMDNLLILLQITQLAAQARQRATKILAATRDSGSAFRDSLREISIHLGSISMAEGIVRDCEENGISVISFGSDSYPEQLYRLALPPLVLFVRASGNELPECTTLVSVVGSRKADAEGVMLTKQLCHRLRSEGVTVVSGLAYGIDSASHWAALEIGDNTCPTVAVMPGGLDLIYPRAHEKLAAKILDSGGCLVSEYAPGIKPQKVHFLERNRIVAALSSAVVIMQASWRSGALSTATHAAELGVDVFVVPGPIHAPLYQGNHRLIRSGAFLLSSFDELVEHLGFLPGNQQKKGEVKASQQDLYNILKKKGPMSYQELESVVEDVELAKTLLELEFSGKLRSLPGCKYQAV